MADCGWALSSQRRMEQFLGKALRGYYIGSLRHAHTHPAIQCFLFKQGSHKGWVDIAERAVELLELPFASLEQQVCRFTSRQGDATGVPVSHELQYEVPW